jgi:cell division protein ZapE
VSGTPLDRYRDALDNRGFRPDPAQLIAVEALDRLHHKLLDTGSSGGLLTRLIKRKQEEIRGLYMWGGVGRGKTWLMDLFYESLPFDNKLRLHFHRFMYHVHEDLIARSTERDPLPAIAADWASRARVLCFDEFYVSDIADAMLLGGLFQGLISNGVTLVATSNIPPDDLYRDGLQRARFLPAIELLKSSCDILELDSPVDYRLRILEQAEIYHAPLDGAAEEQLARYFDQINPGDCTKGQCIDINGREFLNRCRGDGVIWFDFAELCDRPSAPPDYIEIARSFNTVLLSNIPVMSREHSDQLRRFITLVDEFYDRGVKLIMSAAAPLEDLFEGDKQPFELARCKSRLTEMQSHDYLAAAHRP